MDDDDLEGEDLAEAMGRKPSSKPLPTRPEEIEALMRRQKRNLRRA